MPLIYPPRDPRRADPRLYKGGDPSGDMRRMEEERQKKVQAAVDAINARFGIGPAGGQTAAPAREQFVKPGSGRYVPVEWGTEGTISMGSQVVPGTEEFDEAGYQAALAQHQAQGADIDAAKVARERMYGDLSAAVRDTALRDLDRQYTDVSRRNKFGLARSGLLGGSVDAESGGELSELYGEGRMKAEQAGVHAASDLRGQDEQTRQRLIGLAQSGLDVGSAASMADSQLRAAADSARAQSATAAVGDIFGDLQQAYLQNQVLRTRYPNGLPQQQSSGYGANGLYSKDRYVGNVQR